MSTYGGSTISHILILSDYPKIDPWFSYTKKSLPPLHEMLGVRRRFAHFPGGTVDEEATWNGKVWTRKHDGETFPLNHYYAWRRYEV